MLNLDYDTKGLDKIHTGSTVATTRVNMNSISNSTTPISRPHLSNEISAQAVEYAFGDVQCQRDKAYLSIVITILPLWAILTAILVLLLLCLHSKLRSTKVYDNCTKRTSNNVYHIELRTGESSNTYSKKRTTINIDMFDENQNSLARVVVPGYLIFGRLDAPATVYDDDKFTDLRITRFWLYRSAKLKRVATIRLTHNCLEPEAKIMVFGVEIRSNEPHNHKTFFPVMSYISIYGSTTKPNACFDYEPAGSIELIGGPHPNGSPLNPSLSWLDYTIFLFCMVALIFFLSNSAIIPNHNFDMLTSVYNGLLIGLISFSMILIISIGIRFVVKEYYSRAVGLGGWAIIYYICHVILMTVSTGIWIFTTVITHKKLCSDWYSSWSLLISVAVIEALVLSTFAHMVIWLFETINPKRWDQYLTQDEANTDLLMKSGPNQRYLSNQHQSGTTRPSGGHQQWGSSPYPHSYPPLVGLQQTQPPLPPPAGPTNSGQQYRASGQQYGAADQHPVTYHQQTVTKPSSHRAAKKIGSNESTGSSYYHQLMKQKGGVKSISQYGELLRQKKKT